MINNIYFRHHLIPLLILSSYYLVSYFFFNSIILSPHDNLDIGPVYTHVISKIIKGNFEAYKTFLSGEFKWFYLDSIFYPINLILFVLSDKQFYFFKEILFKLISYYSFFLFSKSFFNNKNFSTLGALFYTILINNFFSTLPTIFLPILPYLLYLITLKRDLKFKHYLIIFLVGLNCSLVFDYLSIAPIILFFFCFNKKSNFNNFLIFFLLFSLSILISSIPVFLTVLDELTHRSSIAIANESFIEVLFLQIQSLIDRLKLLSLDNLFYYPTLILKIIILFFFLASNNRTIRILLLFIFLTFLLQIYFSSSIFQRNVELLIPFLKGLNFSRIKNILPFSYSFLLVAIIYNYKKNIFTKYIIYLTIFATLCSQLYLPTETLIKSFIKYNVKEQALESIKLSYQNKNIYKIFEILNDQNNLNYEEFKLGNLKTNNTFDNYYKFKTYKKIKEIVGSSRVASLGIDPMIAVMNDINVIDGYHNIYSLRYKLKFRKIIEKELDQNLFLKNYYDLWGNRVYLFYNDKNNILINFLEAKKIGAEYIISNFAIKNNKLEPNCLICGDDDNVYLYKIIQFKKNYE